jgi:hypothetical protein
MELAPPFDLVAQHHQHTTGYQYNHFKKKGLVCKLFFHNCLLQNSWLIFWTPMARRFSIYNHFVIAS